MSLPHCQFSHVFLFLPHLPFPTSLSPSPPFFLSFSHFSCDISLSLCLISTPSSLSPSGPAVGRHACVVCGRLPGQCQEWCHHGQLVRHGDPARDRHQQPTAPAQAAPCHPGDGLTHLTLCSCLLSHRECPGPIPAPAGVANPQSTVLRVANPESAHSSSVLSDIPCSAQSLTGLSLRVGHPSGLPASPLLPTLSLSYTPQQKDPIPEKNPNSYGSLQVP